MAAVDRASPVPIRHQLKTLIERQIERGLWRPGDRIPTERELCQTHNISRSPVRQALNELAHEGLVVRRPGLGTFVTDYRSDEATSPCPLTTMCSDPHWFAVLDRVSDIWNDRHPGQLITFDVEVVPHASLYDVLSTAVAGGTAPDMAMVDGVWVTGVADAGLVYAFEHPGSAASHSTVDDDMHPAFVDANSLDDQLYGLPVKADASVLWYRRDWFAREGLSCPEDWNDFLNVATHFLRPEVKARNGLTWPSAFPGGTAGGEATVYSLLPFMWSAGGDIIDVDAGSVALASAETVRALQFLHELVRHRASSPEIDDYGPGTSLELFAEGRVAMALGGSYQA